MYLEFFYLAQKIKKKKYLKPENLLFKFNVPILPPPPNRTHTFFSPTCASEKLSLFERKILRKMEIVCSQTQLCPNRSV